MILILDPAKSAAAAIASPVLGPAAARKQARLKREAEMQHEKDKYAGAEWLPYTPVPGDQLDDRIAQDVNGFWLDVHIRKVRVTKKKALRKAAKRKLMGQEAKDLYRVGKKKVHVRSVRGVLMLRVDGVWHDFIEWVQEYMQERAEQGR